MGTQHKSISHSKGCRLLLLACDCMRRDYEYAEYEGRPKGLYTRSPCPVEPPASKLKSDSSYVPSPSLPCPMPPKTVIKLPSESAKQGSRGLTETESTMKEPACTLLVFSLGILWDSLQYEEGAVSDSFACSQDPLLPTGLPRPALICGEVPSLIALCYAVFQWHHWRPVLVLRETQEQ